MRKNASRAEASSTASATILAIGFRPPVARAAPPDIGGQADVIVPLPLVQMNLALVGLQRLAEVQPMGRSGG